MHDSITENQTCVPHGLNSVLNFLKSPVRFSEDPALTANSPFVDPPNVDGQSNHEYAFLQQMDDSLLAVAPKSETSAIAVTKPAFQITLDPRLFAIGLET